MILEYHRPETIAAALALLERKTPASKPMGGGTVLNQPGNEPVAAVDLQLLGLDGWEIKGTTLHLGACLPLQSMMAVPGLPAALVDAIQQETNYNLRQVATLAGSLVAGDGRSSLATALLSLDAGVQILRHHQKPVQLSLGELFPMRQEKLAGALITQVVLPANARLAYAYAARTPADRPLVCVAVAVWPSGRTRIAIGGWGPAPTLAMDGPEESGGPLAAENASSLAADEWASAEYRRHTASVLTSRCLADLQANS